VNNLSLETLSLCLDYSLVNNYWVIQALEIYLNALEREEKFKMMADNPILLSIR
jgi:hypothetical protein